MGGLSQPHHILWMLTKTEKCAGKHPRSFFKFLDMLQENEITMVLTEATPENIPFA